jgi:hypothetical protein
MPRPGRKTLSVPGQIDRMVARIVKRFHPERITKAENDLLTAAHMLTLRTSCPTDTVS